jgi:hypothetical protein
MNWKELIKYSTVQLRKLDDEGIPCGIGSGCLLDLNNHRYLLTVFHVVEKSSKWSAQIGFDEEKQLLKALFLNNFCYLGDFSEGGNSIKDVEFSFHPVRSNFTWHFVHRTWKGETLESRARPILTVEDIGAPTKENCYGFAGDILPTSIPHLNAFETEFHIYHGLKYDRLENDTHYFKMPENHPGHEMFQGCSGAPIIGEDGKVVSLVSGGCTKTNQIYGTNLGQVLAKLGLRYEAHDYTEQNKAFWKRIYQAAVDLLDTFKAEGNEFIALSLIKESEEEFLPAIEADKMTRYLYQIWP